MGPDGTVTELNVPVEVIPKGTKFVNITQEEILQAWEGAFRGVIEKAKEHIDGLISRDLVQFLNTTPLVVLSGGTLRNEPLAKVMKEIVKGAGLGDAQCMFRLGGDHE